MTNEQTFEVGCKVLQRAVADPEYRALALRDGTAAVEEVIGRPLPDGVKIRFVENDGATLTLGLPAVRTSDELSDRELEAVAGGRGLDINLNLSIGRGSSGGSSSSESAAQAALNESLAQAHP